MLVITGATTVSRADDAGLPQGMELAPVAGLFEVVQSQYAGRILTIELEPSASPVYEVKLLTDSGVVLELSFDALTLDLASVNGRDDSDGSDRKGGSDGQDDDGEDGDDDGGDDDGDDDGDGDDDDGDNSGSGSDDSNSGSGSDSDDNSGSGSDDSGGSSGSGGDDRSDDD